MLSWQVSKVRKTALLLQLLVIGIIAYTIYAYRYGDDNNLNKSYEVEKLYVSSYGNNDDYQMQLENKKFRNFPYELFYKTKPKVKRSCVKFPKLENLKFNNIYWQVFGILFLYSSYYDNRPLAKENPVIRINAMKLKYGILPKNKMYCQIWFGEGINVVTSLVTSIVELLPKRRTNNNVDRAYMITCSIPHTVSAFVPSAVSLVEQPCDMATNLLRVVHNVIQGDKKDFAVCVKGLDFPYNDMSKYLAEWIEMLSILGVDKIFFYEYDVHPNISKVLQFYRAQGMVEVTPLTLPGTQPNLYGLMNTYLHQSPYIYWESQVFQYHDCFYMNMNRYNYIAMLDTDEIIMPRKHDNWKDLINHLNLIYANTSDENPTHYHFRGVFSLASMRKEDGGDPSIPAHMYMLQNIYRSNKYHFFKSIHNTARVVSMLNHNPIVCDGPCTEWSVPTDIAHVWHYRGACREELKDQCKLKDAVKDNTIYRFKEELIARTTKSLRILNLL